MRAALLPRIPDYLPRMNADKNGSEERLLLFTVHCSLFTVHCTKAEVAELADAHV